MPKKQKKDQKAWVVAVDMGYGHQRAAFPLKKLAYRGEIINANNYRGVIKKDREIWRKSKEFYDFMSRFKNIPFLGDHAFALYDKFQEIPSFYPKRDLSEPSIQLKSIYSLIRKKNWGADLIKKLNKKPIPMVTTFFIPAYMAEVHKYEGEIYSVCTDADVSRAWAPLNPRTSRIKYFAPSARVVERLKLYGVHEENIFLTGFPLPPENVGSRGLNTLKKDLGRRLRNLDPKNKYTQKYEETIEEELGRDNMIKKAHHPLTLMFAVGGAGAQRELGIEIARSLKQRINKKQIRLVLVAGIHNDVNQYFKKCLKDIGLGSQLNRGIKIIFAGNKPEYFKKFNQILRTTDLIWTKPSELSFYAAFGIPIIMAPPIGSQEKFNRKWLMAIGAGVPQEDVRYTNEWLFDWVDSGWFAEAAMQGYFEAAKFGTYNIEKILSHKFEETKEYKVVLQY